MHEPEFEMPFCPVLSVSDEWEDEDRVAGQIVEDNLRGMEQHAQRFCDSLTLRRRLEAIDDDPASQRGRDRSGARMQIMLAESGALACRNFVFALEPVQSYCRRVTAWRDKIDIRAIGRARAAFNAAFPDVEKMRHTIAHPEHYANPEKPWGYAGAGTLSLPTGFVAIDSSFKMQSCLLGDTLVATIDGRVVNILLNEAAASALLDVTRAVFEAIDPVSEFQAHRFHSGKFRPDV